MNSALLFVRKFNAIDNAAFRAVNSGVDTLKASGHLRRLRELNILEQRPKGSATYYVPGERFLGTLEIQEFVQATLFPDHSFNFGPDSQRANPVDNDINLVDNDINLVDNTLYHELKSLRPDLALEIEKVGRRGTIEEIETLILRLCDWKMLRSIEIAILIGRNPSHIKTGYLRRMIRNGLLEYIFPENPSHNKQAYRTTEKGKQELR